MENSIKLSLIQSRGSLLQSKGIFVWQKTTCIIQKGTWRSIPLHWKLIWTFDSNQENVFFQKVHFLAKRPIPGRFILLK